MVTAAQCHPFPKDPPVDEIRLTGPNCWRFEEEGPFLSHSQVCISFSHQAHNSYIMQYNNFEFKIPTKQTIHATIQRNRSTQRTIYDIYNTIEIEANKRLQ